MDVNVIREYLVGLGFSVDNPGLDQFKRALDQARAAAEKTTSGTILDLLKWQFAITSAFATVSGAILGTMDRAAEAEQKYRLMGERMFITTAQAKAMTIATDALGASLDEIAWDPELQKRFAILISDQERLQSMLGPGYAEDMKEIRDMRFELTRMQVVLQYLGQEALKDVFKGLGLGDGDVLSLLKQGVEWLMKNGPRLAQIFANTVVPILKETWIVFKELADVVRLAFGLFSNLIGLLTGDTSLEGTEVTFEKIGRAIQHSVGFLADFLHGMADAERLLLHLATAAELLATGDLAGAKKEASAAVGMLNAGSGTLIGATIGSIGGVPGAMLGGAIGGGIGLLNPYAAPTAGAKGSKDGVVSILGRASSAIGGSDSPSRAEISKIIDQAAKAFSIDPALLRAVAMQESGMRQTDDKGHTITSSAGAMGVMQLMPSTAKGLGIDPNNAGQNVVGGAKELSSLIAKYGDVPTALAAYNWGQGNLDKAMKNGGHLPAETQNYVQSIMGSYNRSRGASAAAAIDGGGDVYVGGVTVNVPQTNASPAEIGAATAQAIDQRLGKRTARQLTELSGAYV